MAYNMPGDPGSGSKEMAPAGGMHEPHQMAGAGEGDILHISADMLPKGMKLNKGDIVEFKVIGDQDGDGDWPIEYNYGEGKGKEGEGAEKPESWEDGLMKEMSPRSGGEEGQQPAY